MVYGLYHRSNRESEHIRIENVDNRGLRNPQSHRGTDDALVGRACSSGIVKHMFEARSHDYKQPLVSVPGVVTKDGTTVRLTAGGRVAPATRHDPGNMWFEPSPG